MNGDIETAVAALQGLLAATLGIDDRVSFSSLKRLASIPSWRHADLERAEPAPVLEAFLPPPPSGLSKMFGKNTREQAAAAGHAAYAQAAQQHQHREQQRYVALASARADWQAAAEQASAEARKQHQEIAAFEADYRRGDLDAVVSYCYMVLAASRYPEGFPQKFKLAYVPESRQLVVEYELPTVHAVPAVKTYRYVKTSDTIPETSRPQTQIKAPYASAVAQIAVRTVHELLEADNGGHIDTVVFNGVVDTTDPGSGRPVRPCLVTLRTTRDVFEELDLAHVEPLACLKHLSAGVSKKPGRAGARPSGARVQHGRSAVRRRE